MNRQGPNGIEYFAQVGGFTWSPVTGCEHACGFCYAERQAREAQRRRLPVYMGMEPRFWPKRLNQPLERKKPSHIGVVFRGDLFGSWVSESWIQSVLDVIEEAHWHKFLVLTKNPARYVDFKLPANLWAGTSTTGNEYETASRALDVLVHVRRERRVLSIEPMRDRLEHWTLCRLHAFSWVLIGGESYEDPKRPGRVAYKAAPSRAVDEIRELCGKCNGPSLFIKKNAGYRAPVRDSPEGWER